MSSDFVHNCQAAAFVPVRPDQSRRGHRSGPPKKPAGAGPYQTSSGRLFMLPGQKMDGGAGAQNSSCRSNRGA